MRRRKPIIAKRLRDMAAAGMSKIDVARETGMKWMTVHKYAREFGIAFPDGRKGNHGNGRRRGGVSPLRAACIAGRGKFSARVLAAHLGVSKNTVIGHWRRAREEGHIS